MEEQIQIKGKKISDPAKQGRSGGMPKKRKKVMEDKIFIGGKKDKNLLAKGVPPSAPSAPH